MNLVHVRCFLIFTKNEGVQYQPKNPKFQNLPKKKVYQLFYLIFKLRLKKHFLKKKFKVHKKRKIKGTNKII